MSAGSVAFCRPTDPTPRLAVVGVIGVETQRSVRDAIRRTWLPGASMADMLALFVLRGIGVQTSTLDEASQHQDVLFLQSDASMSRLVGPLHSLWQWLECAHRAWPGATFIGKAETDTWLDLPGIAARVLVDLEAIDQDLAASASTMPSTVPQERANRVRGSPRVYWGIMESFHWNLRPQRPKGFAYKFGGAPTKCYVREPGPPSAPTGAVRTPPPSLPLPANASSVRDMYVGPFNFVRRQRPEHPWPL